LIWTKALHKLFLEALSQLKKPVMPKSILKYMNIEGLTRENISSHLQKFRLRQLRQDKKKAKKNSNNNNGNSNNATEVKDEFTSLDIFMDATTITEADYDEEYLGDDSSEDE